MFRLKSAQRRYQASRYKQLKAKKQCIGCKLPAQDNKIYCLNCANENKEYSRTIAGRYRMLKGVAKRLRHECTISFEEYSILILQLCFYCNSILPETGGGLDRINSNIGYVHGNCRPCCTHCNRAKSNMTENEFKEWSLRLFNHWGSK